MFGKKRKGKGGKKGANVAVVEMEARTPLCRLTCNVYCNALRDSLGTCQKHAKGDADGAKRKQLLLL